MNSSKGEWGQIVPKWSPPLAPGPYVMESWEGIMVEFEVPREEIDRLTPAPLQAAAHNRLFAAIVDACQLPHSMFYHEALILQEASFNGVKGFHIPYIWTSTDTALLAGREIYGMPKLMCDDGKLEVFGNEIFGDLRRFGKIMMEAAVIIDEKGSIDDLPDLSSWLMVRHVPTPDPAYKARRQIVHATVSDFEIERIWKGRGWLRMGYPSTSGLDRLSCAKPLRGIFGKFGWVLHHARILDEIEY